MFEAWTDVRLKRKKDSTELLSWMIL